MSKTGFRLQPGKLRGKGSLIGLDFYLLDEEDHYDPVIGSIHQVNYGELFAYLFRRFGYPVYGWDGYKALVKYVLTTPLKDMWLSIIPYPGHNDLTFSFLVKQDVRFFVVDWERADIGEWERRRLAWYLDRFGKPDWADELCKSVGDEVGGGKPVLFDGAVAYFQMLYPRDGVPKSEWSEIAKQFFDSMKPFEDEHDRPGFRRRVRNIEEWATDDPLKPYAQAAVVALGDLSRPVRVRDWAISAFGPSEDGCKAIKECPSAGYAAGALLNLNNDPESAIAANALIEANGGVEWLKRITDRKEGSK
jgi:hypothetical protein